MGSDNAREKRGMVLPSRKKKVGGVAGNSNLFVLLLCVGAVFAAGLFVSFLHFVNYASDNHNNHAFEKMTRSQPVQTTRGEIRSSLAAWVTMCAARPARRAGDGSPCAGADAGGAVSKRSRREVAERQGRAPSERNASPASSLSSACSSPMRLPGPRDRSGRSS